jgi:tetratricopeptide (TPR) repeat protein
MTRSAHQFTFARRGGQLVLLILLLFLYGCGGRTVIPVYTPPSTQGSQEPVIQEREIIVQPEPGKDAYSGPAAPYYRKARAFMDQKDYRQAELMMERALRIEPKNGYYWYTLAEIKFGEQQFARTVQLCLKSKSMAGNDARLLHLNEQLMEKAR